MEPLKWTRHLDESTGEPFMTCDRAEFIITKEGDSAYLRFVDGSEKWNVSIIVKRRYDPYLAFGELVLYAQRYYENLIAPYLLPTPSEDQIRLGELDIKFAYQGLVEEEERKRQSLKKPS